MTCANWGITVLALVIAVLTIWPTILSAVANQWIIVIASVAIIVVVWTGCDCKWCKKPRK